jgi:hypothetical protein
MSDVASGAIVSMRGWWLDGLVALGVFVIAGWWGTHYWHASEIAGREPSFYQEYFEPAAMVACGHGYAVAMPSVDAVRDFLGGKRDHLDCREIPPTVTFRFATFQSPWRYLMLSVAATWRIRGISWSAVAPLSGALFGAAVSLSYGIFRLGMGRLFALGGAFSFAVAPIHLVEIPHLRDYSKAPFALGCLLILGVMVARPLRPRAVLALAAFYGALVGIGYGFRSDLLIYLPPFFVTVFAFTPGGLAANLRWKALSGVVCIVAFVAAAWPILSVVARNGSCLWHFMLLGLTNTFTENLRLIPGPYDFGHTFADRWVYSTITAFAERRHPDLGLVRYCSPEYDVVGREYFLGVVRAFPADMVTRGLGSILGIFREALWRPAPLPDFAPTLYIWRDRFLRHLPGSGLAWVLGAVLVAVSADVRIGLFLMFFVLYFAGYPAIQFHPRHDFHLEFIPWWGMGFTVWQIGRSMWARAAAGLASQTIPWAEVRRVCVFALGCSAVLAATLFSVRLVQNGIVRRMFDAYIAAPKQRLDYAVADPGRLHTVSMSTGHIYPSAFLEVDIRTTACGPSPSVTIRYEPRPDAELSRTVVLERAADSTAVTRVFTPVYEYFQGLEFSDERQGCVAGIYRVTDLRPFPILVNATLSPTWASQPLHQRIADPQ